MAFKKDSFVRWSSKDEDGPFSIVGQVISSNKDGTTFYSDGHEYFIPVDDGKIASARKPKDWDQREEKRVDMLVQLDVERKSKPPPVEKPKVKRAPSSPKTGTKKEKAKVIFDEIFSAKAESGRGDIIKRFQAELDMTSAGAATYYSNFKAKRW